MIPAPFDYFRPSTLDEALELLVRHGNDAKVLAGGHSLLPAMKLRLARPGVVIDIGRLSGLRVIRKEGEHLVIGALSTHDDIESSPLLKKECPLMPIVASVIGDPQIRNRGTIGGNLAHADPAADWPAATFALDAEFEIAGPAGSRRLKAQEFFVDMFQSGLDRHEILTAIRVPATARTVAYEKFAQKASGLALCGVAVVKDREMRIGITGVASKAYRAVAVEKRFAQGSTDASLAAVDGIDVMGDIHASAEFRANLARVCTARALDRALKGA